MSGVRMPSITLRRNESFSTAMRQNAAEYDAAEEIDDSQEGLNFKEFCDLVREREIGDHTPQELRKRIVLLTQREELRILSLQNNRCQQVGKYRVYWALDFLPCVALLHMSAPVLPDNCLRDLRHL